MGEEYVDGGTTLKKLTLSMDEKDIRAARRLAREQGISISGMFTRLVRVMAARSRERDDHDFPPLTRKLSGIISLPKGRSDAQIVEEAILERHGFRK